LRVTTKEDSNPSNWVVSTVINNIGPVTSAVVKLQDRRNHNLWLYFGTGRFFYRTATTLDDSSGQRALYGLKEPCYTTSDTINKTCTSALTTSGLTNQSSDSPSSTLPSGSTGWYINLDASTSSNGAERVVTDPLAVFSGIVFFTTNTPSAEVCSLGGSTYIWAVKYDAGTQYGGIQGKAIIQVSTGAIQEISLASAFTGRGGRRTASIQGLSSKGQGLSVLVGPRPLKRILHMKEK